MNVSLLCILCLAILVALVMRRRLKKPRLNSQEALASLERFNVSGLALLLSSSERTYLQSRLPWRTFYKLHLQRTAAALAYLYELESAISSFYILVMAENARVEIQHLAAEAVEARWLILRLKVLALASLILPSLDLSAEKVLDFRDRALNTLRSSALDLSEAKSRSA